MQFGGNCKTMYLISTLLFISLLILLSEDDLLRILCLKGFPIIGRSQMLLGVKMRINEPIKYKICNPMEFCYKAEKWKS